MNDISIKLNKKYFDDNEIQKLSGTYFTISNDWIQINNNTYQQNKITIYKPNNGILAILYRNAIPL